MSEFPSQSHKAREPREIQPVTMSPGRVRSEPAGRRMLKTIFLGDARSTLSEMLWNSFLPNLRDNINWACQDAIDNIFNGGVISGGRGSRRRSGGGLSITNRHNPDRALGGVPSERISRTDRNSHNFKVIEIDSRAEAEAVLEAMLQLIDSYDIVRLAEFYEMVRITPEHTDYKWGWEDLGGAGVVHSRGFWYLDLPDPIILK